MSLYATMLGEFPMNNKALKTLEYNKIISTLAEQASSELGKKLCIELVPSCDLEYIQTTQQNTSDALRRVWSKGSISFSGVKNIIPSLKRLEIGSSLNISELLEISSLLTCALNVKTYLRGTKEDEVFEDTIDEMFNFIEPLSPLNSEITRCIISLEEVADDASSNLKTIRRTIKNTNAQVHNQLSSIISSAVSKSYLQDSLITMRNGRYCVPVKQEYRGQVPGMIHDQSSTGATLFIEPMAVVKLNNSLRELAIKEQEEIEVILSNLSNLAAEYIEPLETNLEVLKNLDFIFAKAKLAKFWNCSMPIFNNTKYINIKQGRHPLIDAKSVVPIDIHLGDEFSLLIITGPNTGGKTVSLKTVGLLTLMGQAGLHIPAFEGSELSIFNEVYADIGDEQSIEQNLSTFSSHMVNVINIIKNADCDSLVLFDELGSGTDPVEGAALAMSILTFLHNMDVRTMATTHYSELKTFALSTDGVQNACCEFDVETLQPTYKLLIGIPGKSNAFAISGKLGLPDYIIQDAKALIHEDSLAFEDVISELESNRMAAQKEREELARLRAEIDLLQNKLTEKSDKLEQRRERILREANEEANKVLKDAKSFADKTIRDINKLSQGGNTKGLEESRRNIREKIDQKNSKLTLKPQASTKKHSVKDFHIGDAVKVLSLGINGTVSTLPNARGDLYVQMGILRSQVNIRDLIIIDEPVITAPNLKRTSSGKMNISKSSTISTEINLLGRTSDDAVMELDKYLDDAYISGLGQVRVVHGKGTGALRLAVHNYLRRQKHVKTYRLGEFGEGDAGVTIVQFK